jgi:hypothetical protein
MSYDTVNDAVDTVMVRLSGKKTNEYMYEKKYIYSLEKEKLLEPKRTEKSVSGNYWQDIYPLHPGKYLMIEVSVDDTENICVYKCLTVFAREDYLASKRKLFPGAELKPFKLTYQHGGFEIIEWEEDFPDWLPCEFMPNSSETNVKDVRDVKDEKEGYKQSKEVEDKLSLLIGDDSDDERKKSSVQYLIHKKGTSKVKGGINMSKSEKEDTVRVIYFSLGKKPEVGNMENSVEGMRTAIGGGYVQVLKVGIENMVILCDEEGLMKQLHYNRGLRGDWLIVGTRGEEFVSLTDQQVKWVVQNIKHVNV